MTVEPPKRAKSGHFPFVATLLDADGDWTGTGAIVGPHHVVAEAEILQRRPPRSVAVGCIDQTGAAATQTLAVRRCAIHPAFESARGRFPFGLVEVQGEIAFDGAAAAPVTLRRSVISEEDTYTAVGWCYFATAGGGEEPRGFLCSSEFRPVLGVEDVDEMVEDTPVAKGFRYVCFEEADGGRNWTLGEYRSLLVTGDRCELIGAIQHANCFHGLDFALAVVINEEQRKWLEAEIG